MLYVKDLHLLFDLNHIQTYTFVFGVKIYLLVDLSNEFLLYNIQIIKANLLFYLLQLVYYKSSGYPGLEQYEKSHLLK